jgi:hypothetical protein
MTNCACAIPAEKKLWADNKMALFGAIGASQRLTKARTRPPSQTPPSPAANTHQPAPDTHQAGPNTHQPGAPIDPAELPPALRASPMVAVGLLAYTIPGMQKHPEQRYTVRPSEAPES